MFRSLRLCLYALFNQHLPFAAVTITDRLQQLSSPIICCRYRHLLPGAVITTCHLLPLLSTITCCSYHHLSPAAVIITSHLIQLRSPAICRYRHSPPATARTTYHQEHFRLLLFISTSTPLGVYPYSWTFVSIKYSLKWNKEVVANTHLFSSRVASSAAPHTKLSSSSSSDIDEASLTSLAEAEYIHPLLEGEASEGSGCRFTTKSYETGNYRGLLFKRDRSCWRCSRRSQALNINPVGTQKIGEIFVLLG